MGTNKVIIDTDPGIDDAMAIHMAFADPSLDIIGLTSIFGNVFTEQATRNALFLAEQAHYKVPVARGAEKPRVQPANKPSHHVHGDEGFGDYGAPSPKGSPDPRPATQFLSDVCRQHNQQVIICPIGPLTNIAELLDRDPEIVQHVKKLVIMGGAVWCDGNVTKFAEANIWNDPHAADQVFAADWEIDLIGLDVTQNISCTLDDFENMKKTAPEIGGFLYDISEFYIKFYHSVMNQHICLLHDPSAILAITNPELFTYRQAPLRVICDGDEIGQTIADPSSGRRAVNVAVGVKIDQLRQLFLAICGRADNMCAQRRMDG